MLKYILYTLSGVRVIRFPVERFCTHSAQCSPTTQSLSNAKYLAQSDSSNISIINASVEKNATCFFYAEKIPPSCCRTINLSITIQNVPNDKNFQPST
ncbi:hypothetical protein AVEN_144610-1 [Araneus ventricosus]|uniref:Uncharacterized protein n=1 Tax=Araneus ventricosus TaxID=182803 RepID=A0A4Y2BZC9_ARAVE|nr:hypothetical protein AVEN_144610-1 [Araneus ventricosus]